MAVVVATPGRLLQHLEQTAQLDVGGLRVLVLDEADRLLDMGFADTLNSIIGYLPAPPQRQVDAAGVFELC
jgi:ATP-dependent RNA helicase DDX10/DBP4